MARILIVDDMESIRKLLSTALASEGHDITTAANAPTPW